MNLIGNSFRCYHLSVMTFRCYQMTHAAHKPGGYCSFKKRKEKQ